MVKPTRKKIRTAIPAITLVKINGRDDWKVFSVCSERFIGDL